jgi:hypothetical protein
LFFEILFRVSIAQIFAASRWGGAVSKAKKRTVVQNIMIDFDFQPVLNAHII